MQQFLLGKTLSAKQSVFSTQKSDTPLPSEGKNVEEKEKKNKKPLN